MRFTGAGGVGQARVVDGWQRAGQYEAMLHNVHLEALQAHLSEHLQLVRQGDTLTVFDGEMPVARVVPYAPGEETLEILPARRKPSEAPPAGASSHTIDSLSVLLQDRAAR